MQFTNLIPNYHHFSFMSRAGGGLDQRCTPLFVGVVARNPEISLLLQLTTYLCIIVAPSPNEAVKLTNSPCIQHYQISCYCGNQKIQKFTAQKFQKNQSLK
jgi:hypothetical protein